ncbi:MAG: RNA methyltransferase [Thermoleophilaceae bacterium]|nr:RNA methyltransferase [Thermoleophilaceae bacterium]
MITSPHNAQLKTIRRLQRKRERERSGLAVAEGEDLVAAAAAAGFEPEVLLTAGVDVEPALLDEVSALGSGTRVVGVYRQRWSEPGGELSVYLHGVRDPGNVGTVIRCAHALCDGPVILDPGCADPWSPKAVRASMGSAFARPPARARFEELEGSLLALDQRAERELSEVEVGAPVVLCLGSEREGLPAELLERVAMRARIRVRAGGPESINVAMAAAIALYECTRTATRMAGRA